MGLSLGIASVLALVLATAGCSPEAGGGDRRDSGPRPDTGGGSMDSGTVETCTTDAECDDSIACTSDSCGVGNVCRHLEVDALCPTEGERCVAGIGCTAGTPAMCGSDAECDDGSLCTGMETCVGPAGSGMCFPGRAMDCDDGNDCTLDRCNPEPAVDGCEYELAPGCDAGTSTLDGGVPCGPFEGIYAGTYSFRPTAVSACTGSATYSISEAIFSVSGDRLDVRLDRFTLTQSPAPTDGTFDVSFSDGCGSFRLVGEFACADRWSAMWTASFSGTCGLCSGQMSAVRGSRR